MALAAAGAVTLHTQKYALDDFQQAVGDLDSGNVRGRAILAARRPASFDPAERHHPHHREVPDRQQQGG